MEPSATAASARRYVEASNAHDLEAIAAMLHADARYRSVNVGSHQGRDAILDMMGRFFAELPDVRWQVERYEPDGPDQVAFDFVMRATDAGGADLIREGRETIAVGGDGLIREIRVAAREPAAADAAPPRGFDDAEFGNRTRRAQRLMADAGLDALLLCTEPEVRWFTGFLTQFWASPTRPWFVVVPADGKPIAVIPEIGAAGMDLTWIDDLRTWPAPVPEDDGVSLLAACLSELPRRHGRIGLPMGHESSLRMPLADLMRLRDAPGTGELVDARPLTRALREIKSEAEIDKIRHVCRLTSDAFEALPGAVATGMDERGICRTLKRDILARGADDTPYLIGASGPGSYDNIIMGPTDRVVGDGDVMIIDTGATYDGYFCDFDRNWAFGAAGDAVKRAHQACWDATEAALAAARPGATAEDLWRAMWRVLEDAGATDNGVGRLGHGLGMQLTEGHSNMPGDHTVMRPGLVLTLEPGMTFGAGQLMVHEENIVVREDGPEMLTRRGPRELPEIH